MELKPEEKEYIITEQQRQELAKKFQQFDCLSGFTFLMTLKPIDEKGKKKTPNADKK